MVSFSKISVELRRIGATFVRVCIEILSEAHSSLFLLAGSIREYLAFRDMPRFSKQMNQSIAIRKCLFQRTIQDSHGQHFISTFFKREYVTSSNLIATNGSKVGAVVVTELCFVYELWNNLKSGLCILYY